jgi:hypothetical protein
MAYELGGVMGDWGPELWLDDTGTTPNNGPQVQANDPLTLGTNTQGEDRWTGFFQAAAGKVLEYAVQRDAAKAGMVRATSASGQPVYVQQQAASPRPGGMSVGGILVIGVAVLGAVLLVKK